MQNPSDCDSILLVPLFHQKTPPATSWQTKSPSVVPVQRQLSSVLNKSKRHPTLRPLTVPPLHSPVPPTPWGMLTLAVVALVSGKSQTISRRRLKKLSAWPMVSRAGRVLLNEKVHVKTQHIHVAKLVLLCQKKSKKTTPHRCSKTEKRESGQALHQV